MTNPLLLAVLPLSQWNGVNHFCKHRHVSLHTPQKVQLKEEGRSIDILLRTGKLEAEMIGLLYMERYVGCTNEDLEDALRQIGHHPDVVNLPGWPVEEDMVFVYYEWFEDLEGEIIPDWRQVHSALVQFFYDRSACLPS